MSSVTEVKQAPGRWQLDLIEGTPRAIIDQLTPFGHIAIVPGNIDVSQVGDNLLTEARYVGVYRGGKVAAEGFSLEGSGMAFWVGDEDGKGPLLETVAVSAATFAAAVTAILPDAVEVGTLYSIGSSATLTHTFQWETAKSALNYVTRAFGTPTAPVSWRINGDATVDAGPDSQLFNLQPTAVLVKKDQVLRTGRGADVIGVSGDLQLEEAYNDYTTKVVVIGQGEGGAYIAASASLAASAIAYSDMHGNPVSFTRLVDSVDEDGISVANALAASLLSRFDSASYGATLSSDDFDVRGEFLVGDHVACFAPDIGFVNYSNEMYYEGVPINPVFLQVQGLTWPIPKGFTVGFRTMSGTWLDLSDYYRPTGGQTLIDVGENPSGLTSLGFDVDRSRFTTDSSVPATPVFGTFFSSNYLNDQGDTRAQILVTWTEPDNTDGSTIIDGHHYEIRYRPNVTLPYSATWGEAAQDTWDELFTWMQPRVPPFDTDEWQVVEAPFDVEQFMVLELFPSVTYEFQIRAVDAANPPNRSAWSASQAFTAARDTIPPAQPAAPIVAGSRLGLQVIHYLGRNDGGTFNLDHDTQWLEIHVAGDPLFFPTEATLAGRVSVAAALAANTPVVAGVLVEETTERYVRVVAVDRQGNRSNASDAATSSAELIDDAHISDLTVSKLTAGTMTANIINAGNFRTGESGRRIEFNSIGLQAYDEEGLLSTNFSSDTSETGQFISFRDGPDTLAAIDELGNGNFQTVYANTIYLGGDNLRDKLVYEPPRGIIAFGKDGTSYVEGAGIDMYRGAMEVAFDAEDGRAYKIAVYGPCSSTTAVTTDRFIYRVNDGGASTPTISDPSVMVSAFPATHETGRNTDGHGVCILRCPEDITAGNHRLLWIFKSLNGVANWNAGDGPAYFWIEDIGPSDWLDNTGVVNDGGVGPASGGGAGAPPTSVKSYTRTYTATWSASYDNDRKQMSVKWVGQGEDDTYGTLRSLWGFPSSIEDDLDGATIKSAKFTAYANWWEASSGGTMVLGTHQYNSAPSTIHEDYYDVDMRRISNWPKPGALTVTLSSTFHDQLKSGEARGFMVGAAGGTLGDGAVYHGKFDGATQSRPASLQIVYTK